MRRAALGVFNRIPVASCRPARGQNPENATVTAGKKDGRFSAETFAGSRRSALRFFSFSCPSVFATDAKSLRPFDGRPEPAEHVHQVKHRHVTLGQSNLHRKFAGNSLDSARNSEVCYSKKPVCQYRLDANCRIFSKYIRENNSTNLREFSAKPKNDLAKSGKFLVNFRCESDCHGVTCRTPVQT